MQFVNSAARTHSLADAIASNLTPEHVAEIIAQKGREPEYTDRESEREHGAGKETRRLAVLIIIVSILAVVGIIVFLTIYQESGLLGYILSGIGGLIAGAFGGTGTLIVPGSAGYISEIRPVRQPPSRFLAPPPSR